MLFSVARLLLPVTANSSRVALRRFSGFAPPTLHRMLSTSFCLKKDEKEEGNPFSIDDMILSSSRENLEDFKVPDPISEAESEQQKFNMDEIILNSTIKEGIEGNDAFDVEGIDTEEGEYMDDDEIAREILDVALEFVPNYGWSQKSIDAAVEALELSMSTAGMFKRGGADLVLHFIETSNKNLFEILAVESKRFSTEKSISTSAFIEKAIQERLKMIIPYIETWPQALSLIASSTVAPDVLEQGVNMIDEIWYHAGDMSTDMSWYSKRAAVAALHLSTELYMLQDKSPDFADTWDFLHRRMMDIESANICKNSLGHAVQDAMNLASAGITTAQNILGLNSRNR